MAQQREARISKAIMEALRKDGVFCFKVHGSALMMSGLPDIIACVDGLFVGLETKLPEKRKNTSPMQKRIHELIISAGGHAEVVCGAQEALELVAGVRDGIRDGRKSLVRKGYLAGYKKAKGEV